MGLFNSFKYVAGVTTEGKPIMKRVKKGNRQGECNAKGYCKQHQTYTQWSAIHEPLWKNSQFFAETDIEICNYCGGRKGYLGPVKGPNNEVPECECYGKPEYYDDSYMTVNPDGTDKVSPEDESK